MDEPSPHTVDPRNNPSVERHDCVDVLREMGYTTNTRMVPWAKMLEALEDLQRIYENTGFPDKLISET